MKLGQVIRAGFGAGAALLSFGAYLAATPAEARTNRALIVAVADYPSLSKSQQLVGPKNDAVLVRDYLTTSAPITFDPADVTVLSDDTVKPTSAAIKAALADMAAKAERGDFIYLQFSGHGTRQPAVRPGTEQDGLDEVFLPGDIGIWKDQSSGIPNALPDDEIGAALDAIRNKGAFVWVVFDACHSATATRAAGVGDEDVVERQVEPEALGIPESAIAAAESAAKAAADGTRGADEREGTLDASDEEADAPSGRGGMVAFFAAQTVETTPEMKLPKGAPNAQKLGLFTFTLFSKLAENPSVTYRQLGQSILQSYSGLNRTKPTPLFEGDLDADVFQTRPGEQVLQWKISVKDGAASLPAGMLHRLTPGTRLAILSSPSAKIDTALGWLEVKSAKNLTSIVAPVASDGMPALALKDIPEGAWARVAEFAVDFEMKVARPPAGNHPDETAAVNRTLDEIAAEKEGALNIRLVDAGAEADLALAVMGEDELPGARMAGIAEPELWFLPPSGEASSEEGRKPPRIAVKKGQDAALREDLDTNLVQIFRATNLARLAVASDFRSDEVSITFHIKRAGSGEFEKIEAGKVPVLSPDDEIHMSAENTSIMPVDVNTLYVGSDYEITPAISPYRLHPGEKFPMTGLFVVAEGSYGMERMIAILTEAEPQKLVEDLGFLAQPGVRPAMRDVGKPGGFTGLIEDLAGRPGTRAVKAIGDKGGSKGAVMIFPMETAPRN